MQKRDRGRVGTAVVMALMVLLLVGGVPATAQQNGAVAVEGVAVEGNENVDTSLILSAVSRTTIGSVLTEDHVLQDLHAI